MSNAAWFFLFGFIVLDGLVSATIRATSNKRQWLSYEMPSCAVEALVVGGVCILGGIGSHVVLALLWLYVVTQVYGIIHCANKLGSWKA